MTEITNTFTADISLRTDLEGIPLELINSANAEILLRRMMGADTVKIRNFKVFVHDKGENDVHGENV